MNGSNNRQRLLELAPLLTTTGYTVEQTEGELAAFYDGAVQKGFGPDTSNEYKSQQFELKNFEQLLELEDPKFIVEDMLLDNSFAMVFGATGSFKSTVVLDMCVCIQHQLPWQGKKTEQRNVAFFSHEDGSGFKKRFLAATSRYSITDPVIYWDDKVPNLIDQKGLTSYIEELKSKEIGLVVIDTFAYSIAGAEENSSKEMGLAVESIKLLSDSIDGTVLIVHHTGKNADRGARGSSVIKAATDSEFKIESDESEIEVASTKQRHCEQAPPMFLKSEVVPVGNATACVIKKSAASPFKRGDYGLRGKSLIAWQVLENLFLEKDDTCDIETYVASLKRSNLFTKGQNHHGSFKKALDRAIKDFQFRNLIDLKDDVICLSEEGLAAIEALRAWKGFNMPHIDEKESEEGF